MVKFLPFFAPAAIICLALCHLLPGKAPRICAIIALCLGVILFFLLLL
jgi:hypothetical protein